MEKKKKIGVMIVALSVVCLLAIVSIIGIVIANNIKHKHENNKPTAPTKPTIVTSSYNEAITLKKLTTQNYSGIKYVYDRVLKIEFNEKSETNKDGLTEEELKTEMKKVYEKVLGNNRIEYPAGYPQLCQYFSDERFKRTKENDEYLKIYTPTESDGEPSEFGKFTFYSKSGNLNGKVYGDENLAVCVNDSDEIEIFMSLNYTTFYDSILVPDEKNQAHNTLYIFEDYYSLDNSKLKLFTITYTYKLSSVLEEV